MATINDIAKLANVSKSTVSRVINNYPDVNEKTKQKIIKIMQENNYWPNTMARSLSTNKSYTIGMFVPTNLNNFFFREVIQGIEYTLGKHGYDLLYFTHQKTMRFYMDTGIKFNFVEKSSDKNVDGIIMLGFNMKNIARFNKLIKSKIPTVFIDVKLTGERASYIISDNEKGAIKAVEYLISLGHQKIGLLLGPEEVKPTQDRLSGCKKVFEKYGLQVKTDWLYHTEYTLEDGYKSMKEILTMTDRPTAIFGEDMMVIGAIRAARDAGLSVPEDISFVGFDNIELSYHYNLTSVNQDQYKMGEKASELLMKIINEEEFNPIVLPVNFVERTSCRYLRN
ncbi:substrate-binding domain-containing protein [Iocasia frigidifontis]|uniref:Substrate-binding domain-containing protein n=1 Tax=Iocasia fonsfrigidae TaxID=2682810 RepID=A0A8A7KB76_9FIRM|nr:LacI family DNA-binding transcriptional regulator [Iocasia fonsfrigidae]QTL99046.1 substrate-binding domain-containing protein [Iocasia fonsfrigidae]